MKRIPVILLIAAAILSGCSGNKKTVSLKGYDVQEITGVEFSKNSLGAGLMLNLDIENQTGRTLILDSGEAILYNNTGKKFGEILITEPVVLPKNISDKINVPLKATFLNPMNIFSSGFLKNGQFDTKGITADIDITIKSGALSKKISKKNVPLDKLADMLGETKDKYNEND